MDRPAVEVCSGNQMALDLQLRAAFARSLRDVEAAGEAGGDPSHKLLLAQKGKKGLEVAFRLLRKARSQVCIGCTTYLGLAIGETTLFDTVSTEYLDF